MLGPANQRHFKVSLYLTGIARVLSTLVACSSEPAIPGAIILYMPKHKEDACKVFTLQAFGNQ